MPFPIHSHTDCSDPADDDVKDSATTLHVVPRPRAVHVHRERVPLLGEILVEQKTLTEEQLREAMTRQQRSKRLGEILMELGFASPDAGARRAQDAAASPPTRVNSVHRHARGADYLSEKMARKYTAMPLIKVGSTLMVATANPRDLQGARRSALRRRL